MADWQTVFNNVAAQQDEIWEQAYEAFTNLTTASTGGYLDNIPASFNMSTLKYDPGIPTPIQLKLPFDMQPVFQKIDDYIQRIANIQPPTIPQAPNFQMQDHEIWDEQFMDDIKTNLWDYIQSMGIPDVSYQNAIFNEDYERNLVILNDVYSLADAKTGARGFSYPNDWGGALKIDAQVKYQYDRTQISRTITKTVTEWARQNYQFAIEKGLSQQQMHMDFTYKYCTAFVDVYKSLVIAILESYKAEIEVLSAPVTLLAKEIEIFMEYAKTSAEIDKTNETLKQSRSDIEIKEALQKYNADSQAAQTKFGHRLQSLQTVATSSATLAHAAASLVVGQAS